ncbi:MULTISPECIES: DUF4232 domain-containing protein [Streptomyces]|uniref:DUF4232 domain-containing protein n=1 Tax=Streptomyces solicathayae TaxID=3081768 RepID=A0ABZ0M478_9ACTN|nr:DUF4232 domain-containing protein [Streptomyces sp. HUAS YS2]WOX26387.1 DUF4232 domain-containing protein [Streptomyces sp. HUAS YS2]
MSTVLRATVVLAAISALTLTACGPGGDDAAGGAASPTASAKPTAPGTKPSAPASKPPAPAPKPSKTAGTPGKESTDPDYDVFPCSTFDVKFTANLAEPTTSSYLLKITNKGTKPCKALGHPVVTFGDLDGQATERGTAPAIEDAIRLAPGQSAYAGLMGGLDDGRGKTVNSIAMTMNTESDLTQTPLKASTPGLYVSPDNNSVTAWFTNAEDALS